MTSTTPTSFTPTTAITTTTTTLRSRSRSSKRRKRPSLTVEEASAQRPPLQPYGGSAQTQQQMPLTAPLLAQILDALTLKSLGESCAVCVAWAAPARPRILQLALPVPGVDFPCPPPPSAASEITADWTWDRIYALEPAALAEQGLVKRGQDGAYWCNYCGVRVSNVARHLHPLGHLHPLRWTSRRQHQRNMEECLPVISRLRADGWMLAYECIRIQQGLFCCGLCRQSGHWFDVHDHMCQQAHMHNRYRANLPFPPTQLSDGQHITHICR
mmetsp:Transcript_13065/g.23291  ORF Transcript_13065/g.23291 Transcript_13065/m.23291 type:complete len:271 (-) Transcript_13065:282-1094(-)